MTTDPMNDEREGLPEGWVETTLGEMVAGVEAGLNVKCEERPPESNERGLVKISAVTWGRFQEDQSKTLSVSTIVPENRRIEPGDFLISRANTIELVGACVIVNHITRNLYLSDKVLRLRFKVENQKSWILHFLRSKEGRNQIESLSSGNQLSMRNLSQNALLSILLPLPPLPEQTRIADKLDALLSRVESGRERLERVPKLLKRFRRSVLSAAVSGELTREWRGGGDAEWEEIAVGDVVTALNGRPFPSAEYTTAGVRLIRPGNLHISGKVVWTEKNTSYLPESWLTDNASFLMHQGDLLMNLTAQSLKDEFLGRVCVKEDNIPALLNQRICAFKPKTKYDVRPYLWVYFKSPQFRLFVDTLDTGTLIKHIHSRQVLAHEMLFPKSVEQTEIVRRVEALFAIADRIEARYQSALTTFNRLTPALLAKAFRGELVPQDPNDESASVLLERIRLARATSGDKPKRGRGAAKETGSVKPDRPAPDNTAPKRRGRPPKAQAEAPGIAQASSYEDAVRQLEAQKAARAAAGKLEGAQVERGTRQGELFGNTEINS
ncbi:hypothetical protein FNU79_09880 [Deinococcus detaillensis]|uniref:Type I restriction modification DNA specificity domain-containing protein n=1 Tax=Deinococcus detaillensis TaxID=2592048 RepID=A0A553UZ50_9DEIO|nr:restriction endonuclease subunit S [Deinococcus detaillensis]TSA85496.1 hypothetical protein FNU79_09880 [Deinococcus detaillensis]